MTPEDLKKYYGNSYQFKKRTGMSDCSYRNWMKWGFVPENSQYKIERMTNGELKADVQEKMAEKPGREEMAFMELKGKIVKLMFDFIDKQSALYPKAGYILVDVLTACLGEAQYQVSDYQPFTSKQTDHICYQIGDWYLMMKPLLEGQHNLGYMKEKLKTMICGD